MARPPLLPNAAPRPSLDRTPRISKALPKQYLQHRPALRLTTAALHAAAPTSDQWRSLGMPCCIVTISAHQMKRMHPEICLLSWRQQLLTLLISVTQLVARAACPVWPTPHPLQALQTLAQQSKQCCWSTGRRRASTCCDLRQLPVSAGKNRQLN
jgi:hypothetical protein